MSEISEEMSIFKCLLLGYEKSGKTAFVKRHISGEFQDIYKPKKCVRISPITFYTNVGPIRFNVWDVSPESVIRESHKEAYYSLAHAAILMFDVANFESYIFLVQNIYKTLKTTCRSKNFPIVLCGNKTDIRCGKIRPADVLTFTKGKIPYLEISVKFEYNLEMPFTLLAQKLLKNENLKFVNMPALTPPPPLVPELAYVGSLRKKQSQIWNKAKKTKVPETRTII